jgi:ribosome biogenesis protein Nip4
MKDALGNDIVVGNFYGYTSTSGGFARTVLGTVTHLTKQKVAVKVEYVNRFLYGKPIKDDYGNRAEQVAVHGYLLFPVNR